MAGVTPATVARNGFAGTAVLALESVLRPYAQALLSRNLVTGLLVLLAIATRPQLALLTLAAVVVSQATTRAMGLGEQAMRDGVTACTAVLTTLALAFSLGDLTWPLVVVAAVVSVLVTMALMSLCSELFLPTLALPFVVASWMVLFASSVLPNMPVSALILTPAPFAADIFPAASWLNIPAAMLYLDGALAGLLVVAAIAWHSRISLVLFGVGAVGAEIMRVMFRFDVTWSYLDTLAAFNAILTAMALGGVWFVPHISSLALALVGAMTTSVVTWALAPVAGVFLLPLLSLPFALTVTLFLLAARMRMRDRMPTSAIPADRPEDALTAHLMRVRRFGDFSWLPLRLPFRGAWLVTQAHNGAHTHKGPWRYAFDFEVASRDGKTYEGRGTEVTDYRCYGLPILSAAAGTIEDIIDGIPDNPIGGVNARNNWGNVVIVSHGANLFSVYAHLRPASIRVKVGDRVKEGAELGRCGNSGRSLTPHLHFQVQRGPKLGNDTVAADFGEVITRSDTTTQLSHRVIPCEGDTVRAVMREEAVARALAFPVGSAWQFEDPASGRTEQAHVEVDMQSRFVLKSEEGQVMLEVYDSGMVMVAFEGRRTSLLRMLPLALARVPFDQEAELTWRDRVPRRMLSNRATMFTELLAVVLPGMTDVVIDYTARRTARAFEVAGTSPGVETRVVVSLDNAPHRMEVRRTGATVPDVVEFRLLPAATARESR